MAMAKAVFYLPTRDNDGRSLKAEIKRTVRDVYGRFAAWTLLGYLRGAFQMLNGTQALDISAAYAVMIDEERVDELEQVLREFRSKTTQEAIYLEIQHNIDFRLVR